LVGVSAGNVTACAVINTSFLRGQSGKPILHPPSPVYQFAGHAGRGRTQRASATALFES